VVGWCQKAKIATDYIRRPLLKAADPRGDGRSAAAQQSNQDQQTTNKPGAAEAKQ
jgi:hypothetical protein